MRRGIGIRSTLVGIVLALAVSGLGGCGTSTTDQVRAKVQQFVTAVQGRDYQTICQQVLAPVLLARLVDAGLPCAQAMRIGLASLKDPSLSIGKITVTGNTARVITLSGAFGQKATLSALQLTHTSSGWRISALGSPLS